MKLFPYQRDGVRFLEKRNGRALLADEMGLGKTIQVLGWLRQRGSLRPVVVVCPASVRLHWQREVTRWLGEASYLPVSKTARGIGYADQTFVIIHYPIIDHWLDWLQRLRPRVLVIDESHLIKSHGARRTKAVKKLAKGVPHVIGLTGTPIVNRPIEAFNILSLIDKKAIPNWFVYTRRYCAPRHNGFGWDYSGASHTDELHKLLTDTVMLRRRKVEVLDSLPAKMRSFIPLSLTNRKEYAAAEADFIAYLQEAEGEAAAARAKRAQALTRIGKLRLLAARGKLEQACEWIADIISEHKLVVFGVHRGIIDPIYERFEKQAVKVAGDVGEKDRTKAVDRFQTKASCRLFVGQIAAAGTGITLTAASHVAFIEMPWTPGDLLQAEDRIHRIGQSQPCVIYYLLANRTIDEDMAKLIDGKRRVLDAVLDGARDTSSSTLVQLLNLYKKRGQGREHRNSDEAGAELRLLHGDRV